MNRHDGPTKVLILGAAGRDFHNFNVCYRDNPAVRVVAFTATQIPNIDGRSYPPELAGRLYSDGIPIFPESEMTALIQRFGVDVAVFSYSDVPNAHVMGMAAQASTAGASFQLLGAAQTMIASTKPVLAVCAVRTGCGKSQTTRRVAAALRSMGKRVAVIRHPMPYGDLARQACQRYGELADMDRHQCTIEEREEYELHIRAGNLLYAGVDYGRILDAAQKEADVILWDGGNNDTAFYKPDLLVTVADPLRPGHETGYYPGQTNFRMADVILINKCDTAEPAGIAAVEQSAAALNPKAKVIRASSPVACDDSGRIAGKRVLLVEDGPTLTHGEMRFGAARVAAQRFGAGSIVDPRPYATGSIAGVYEKYRHLTDILPAMGYGDAQIADLEKTVNATPADLVLIGTPIDLGSLIKINKPSVRIRYELDDQSGATLEQLIRKHPRFA